MEQTLLAAHELFAERGYADVTMEEIAASVGVTKPLLYNYFGNKERLYIACMERAGDALTATIGAAVTATDSPGDAFAAGVRAFFAFLDSDRAAWTVLFDETLPAGGEVADRIGAYRGHIIGLVSGTLLARIPGERRDGARTEVEALSTAPARRRRGARPLVAGDRGAQRRGRRRPPHHHRRARHPRPLGSPDVDFAEPRKRNDQPMNSKTRRVAIVGGNRIPFARSDTKYAQATNQDMLTAALDGLVDRFGLEGETLGEVAGGAVLKHSHDRDLTRESVLSTRLAPETPAYDVQQACGTGLETTILVANKIALGQIDAGIACGADTTSDAPIELNEDLRATLLDANRQRSTTGKLKALTGFRPGHIVPPRPPQRGAADRPLDGRALRDHGDRMGDRPRGPGRADRRLAPQPRRRL